MRGPSWILALLATLALPCFCDPALAGLKACNKSNKNATVSWALAQYFASAKSYNIFIWGWSDIAPGACSVLNGAQNPETHNGRLTSIWYVYARSSAGGRWGVGANAHAVQDSNGVTWNPTMNLCEPTSASVTVDDLHKGCNRLPYTKVDQIDGANYRFDLLP